MSDRWFPLDPAPEDRAPLPPEPQRPVSVHVAFGLYLVAALLILIGLIGGLAQFPGAQAAAEREARAQGQDLPKGWADIFLTGVIMGLVVAVIAIGVYSIFGYLVWKGSGWARWVLVAFAAVAFLGVLGGLLSLIPYVAILVATIVSFLPPSARYFKALSARRAARFA
jgi:hypothetical protein